MNSPSIAALRTLLVLGVLLGAPAAPASAAGKSELEGAAVLEHPIGKLTVKHMGLVHAGKMDEAVKLGSKAMLKEWQGTKPDERKMMSDFMKQMSKSEAAFSAEIKQGGILAIDGSTAQLAVRTGTAGNESAFSQNFELEGGEWRIAP